MKKKNEKLLMIMTLVLCVLLFAQRLTGGILHAVFGVLLAVIMGIHMWRQSGKMKYRKTAVCAVDWILAAAIAVVILTGILLHPLQNILAIKIIHKLSAVVFVLGGSVHMVQHIKPKRK